MIEQAGFEYSIQQQMVVSELGESIILQSSGKMESFEAKEYFMRIDETLLKQREKHIEDLKSSISNLFDEAKHEWEKYLTDPVEGILELIRELTGIKLANLNL